MVLQVSLSSQLSPPHLRCLRSIVPIADQEGRDAVPANYESVRTQTILATQAPHGAEPDARIYKGAVDTKFVKYEKT